VKGRHSPHYYLCFPVSVQEEHFPHHHLDLKEVRVGALPSPARADSAPSTPLRHRGRHSWDSGTTKTLFLNNAFIDIVTEVSASASFFFFFFSPYYFLVTI